MIHQLDKIIASGGPWRPWALFFRWTSDTPDSEFARDGFIENSFEEVLKLLA